jgi:hypothetical protein
LLVALTGFIAMALVVGATRAADPRERLALALIAGGALGNLVDRVRDGMVTDFIGLHAAGFHWPTFNIAECNHRRRGASDLRPRPERVPSPRGCRMMPFQGLPVFALVILGNLRAAHQRVARRIGRPPYTFGSGDTAHDFVGRVYRVGGALLFAFMLLRVVWPEADAGAGQIPWLGHPALAGAGLVTMVVGAVTIVAA